MRHDPGCGVRTGESNPCDVELAGDWHLYGGDAAWTLAACGGFRLLFPRRGSVTIAGLGLLASFGVELSQLIPMRWLQDLRGTTLGALLLGRGFLWSDLIAYAAGAVLAMAIDLPMVRRIRHRPC